MDCKYKAFWLGLGVRVERLRLKAGPLRDVESQSDSTNGVIPLGLQTTKTSEVGAVYDTQIHA